MAAVHFPGVTNISGGGELGSEMQHIFRSLTRDGSPGPGPWAKGFVLHSSTVLHSAAVITFQPESRL